MSPKLQYFDLRGLGEYIRTLLIDNKIDFEDERIQMGEEWEAKKKTMPLGQMPVWNEGEKSIPQSGAILRHLGRIHDLYGENECDRVLIDVMQESLKDMRFKYAMQVVFGDFSKKDEYDKETYPLELQKIEKLFKTRNEGKQFVLGEKLSFVDYVLFEELELALTSNANNLDTVPVLKAFHQRFSQRPNLKEYLAKRAADKPVFHGNGKI